ncbi:hypothetical protein [Prochlorococcus marinus]|nr:hypothetical protein [Prochlorococcus marinus]
MTLQALSIALKPPHSGSMVRQCLALDPVMRTLSHAFPQAVGLRWFEF